MLSISANDNKLLIYFHNLFANSELKFQTFNLMFYSITFFPVVHLTSHNLWHNRQLLWVGRNKLDT